ncbi:MAG: thioredoxin family protein [Parachlamydiales bacterium]|nr:thioredoxin family protein [Parachlamydiales bacterium]
MFKKLRLFLCLLALTPIGCLPLIANESKPPVLQAELISENESINPGEPFWVAILLNLEKGWHIGWKNAGEAGLPTSIQWDLPEGYTAEETRFPTPERFSEMGMTAYGYEGSVVFLTRITPPPHTQLNDTTLNATVKYVACGTSCKPGDAKISLSLPANVTLPENTQKTILFNQWKNQLPHQNIETPAFIDNKEHSLVLPFTYDGLFNEVLFYPEEEGVVDQDSIATVDKTDEGWSLHLPVTSDLLEHPHDVNGLIVVKGENKKLLYSSEIHLSPTIENNTPISNEPPTSLWLIIGGAFLGGLILNLMPCVLPVLSLKVLGVVNSTNKTQREKRLSGWAYLTGVVVSFWGLAGIILGLKSAGTELGWGFQLQDPLFVGMLTTLFFVMALNLYGLFEMGTSFSSVGQKANNKGALVSSFLNGVLATVVATPCTGPFLGTALGVAATLSPIGCLAIFTSMACGMALPFVLVTFFPFMAKFLPKPGAWMETFKQLMGFLLMGAVLWLLWVFGAQQSIISLYQVLFALLVMAIASWVFGHFGNLMRTRPVRYTAKAIAALIAIGSLYLTVDASKSPYSPSNTEIVSNEELWEPYNADKVEKLHREGTPVLIDFTAKWCLICQANHFVLNRPDVLDALKKRNVVLMQADWTRQDEMITKALKKYGRNAVPVYVLYDNDPKHEPVILPQMLTEKILMDNLHEMTVQAQFETKNAVH